jgi:hypothetical protein
LEEAAERLEQDLGNPGDRSESFVAMVRRALGPANAYRALYDLGESLGTYRVRTDRAQARDATPVWDCVGRIPEPLIRAVACLFVLAGETDGERDLDAALGRVNQPWAELLATDDEDQYRSAMGMLSSNPTPWFQKARRAGGNFSEIMFVSQMTRELQSYQGRLEPDEATRADEPESDVAGEVAPCDQTRSRSKAKPQIGKAQSKPRPRGEWAHKEPPPQEGNWAGPITDSLTKLAKYCKCDERTLREMDHNDMLWVCKVHGKRYSVWFKNQSEFAGAKKAFDDAHPNQSKQDGGL